MLFLEVLVRGKRKNRKFKRMLIRLLLVALVLCTLLPLGSQARKPKWYTVRSGTVMATAFNSMESQTDKSPWITASGTRCRPGVIASNFLPFGTKVKIDGFGDRIFVVEDRMNKRYSKRIDIWFSDYDNAMKFGVRKIKYHVLKAA